METNSIALGGMVANVAALPTRTGYEWEWLALLRARSTTLVLALVIGLLSLTAVQDMRVECRNQKQFLTSESGVYLISETGSNLLTGGESQQCQLVVGRAQGSVASKGKVDH